MELLWESCVLINLSSASISTERRCSTMQDKVIYNSPSFLCTKPHYLKLNPFLMAEKVKKKKKIVQLLLTESIPDTCFLPCQVRRPAGSAINLLLRELSKPFHFSGLLFQVISLEMFFLSGCITVCIY